MTELTRQELRVLQAALKVQLGLITEEEFTEEFTMPYYYQEDCRELIKKLELLYCAI